MKNVYCLAALLLGCSDPGAVANPDGGSVGGDGAVVSPDGEMSLNDGAAFQGDLGTTLGSLQAGSSLLTITVAGMMRSVRLYVPLAVSTGPLPLVIALHGNGDTNDNFIASLGLTALADADGFVLAAPQGITQSFTFMGQPISGIDWDAYRSTAQGNIDLPLVQMLREQLVASGSIDAKHVLLFGYSQGGYLSFRAGMDQAAALACTAVIAASDPLPGFGLPSQAARKIPVALQIGTLDDGLSGAQTTHTELTQNGNPVDYHEIMGAGHVPFPGDPKVPLDYCRMQVLP